VTREALWPGPHRAEAVKAFHRAIDGGMTSLRSLVVGCVASFRDCWMFQRQIAQRLGCSLRTVQRALAQARELGLIECHRAKTSENAPGLGRPVPCGWSHRWAIGWGMAASAAQAAISIARTKLLGRFLRRPPKASAVPHRSWTADEIEAELARRASRAPP
jgi:DNA-binding transcriptional MocR family regulator